ncbi:MAG: outer membrane beta-barrel protein [Candidatus Polarisedimenticolia bacterium]
MSWSRLIGPALLACVGVLLSSNPTLAKDVRHLWFIGGTLSYHTTADAVQNHANLEGDPRPDDFVTREMNLDDTVQLGMQGGFGFTESFTLQLDLGYFKGEVGSVDVYREETYPGSLTGSLFALNTVVTREFSSPLTAGVMTQIPVSLTGILRFRKDSVLNPFIGAGVGRVFMEFEPTDDLLELNRTIDTLHIKQMFDESGVNITPQYDLDRFVDDGAQPFDLYTLSFDIEDSWEWHLSAGLEYAMSEHMSLVGEVRYLHYQSPFSLTLGGEVWTYGARNLVKIEDTGPEDQVNFEYWPPALYHPDGSLRVFNDERRPPNTWNILNPEIRYACGPNFGTGHYGPGQTGVDIDENGQYDACYDAGLVNPSGMMIVQAGEIDLSGFHVQLGMRWYW